MGLDAALDRFWEAADARRLGIDAIRVVGRVVHSISGLDLPAQGRDVRRILVSVR
jgi:hypothetical protein